MSSAGQTAGGEGGAGSTGGAAGGTGGVTPWHTGLDAETVGFLQTKGWDKIEAKDAAFNAVKSYREAERHIGAPPDKIVRIPDANDAAAWKGVYQKLGAPAEAKDYDFGTTVKFADGSELDQPFVDHMAKTFLETGVSKAQAGQIAKAVVQFMDNSESADAQMTAATLATQKDALRASWGSKFNTNMIVAQNAFKALGFGKEVVDALESAAGYDKVMEAFRSIGERIGEDQFVRSGTPGSDGPKTKEQAQAELASLKNDAEWYKRFQAGDANAIQKFHTLTRIATGV